VTVNDTLDYDTFGWISRDPIEESGGTNLYEYALNEPMTITDRSGLIPYYPWNPADPFGTPGGVGLPPGKQNPEIPPIVPSPTPNPAAPFATAPPHYEPISAPPFLGQSGTCKNVNFGNNVGVPIVTGGPLGAGEPYVIPPSSSPAPTPNK